MSRELNILRAEILEKLMDYAWYSLEAPAAAGRSYLFPSMGRYGVVPETQGAARQLQFSDHDEDPTADLNHTRRAELRLIEMGLGEKYAVELWMTACLTARENEEGWLMLLTAPAEARCRAMLSVLEGV